MKKILLRIIEELKNIITSTQLRPIAVLEVIIMLCVFLAFDRLFGEANNFSHLQSHPFWIIVLVISAQYGFKEGVFSVVFCSLALYLGRLPRQTIGVDYYEHISNVMHLPLLWFSAAIIIGMIAQRKIAEKDQMKFEAEESYKREKTIARAYEDLKIAKETIEVRLVGQLRSSAVAYRALQSIGTLDPNEVLLNIDELVKTVMRPKKMSVLGIGEQGFEVVSSMGWENDEGFALRIAKESKLYESLLARKKVLCVVNEADEEILDNQGIMIAPLITPDTGQVFGAIKIEEMEFENITLSNIETFTVLAEWISLAYANAKKSQEQIAQMRTTTMPQK